MGTIRAIVFACLGLLAATSAFAQTSVSTTPGGLAWQYGGTPPATVEIRKADNSNGPWTKVATVPAMPASYAFTYSPDMKWYLVSTPLGDSNAVQYTGTILSYDDAAVKARMTTIEGRNTAQDQELAALKSKDSALDTKNATQDQTIAGLTASIQGLIGRIVVLETATPPPPATSTVVVKQLSNTQIEVTCTTGKAPTQVLSGLKRTLSCQ